MDHEAGRSGLVGEVQPDFFAAEAGQEFFQRMQVVGDLAVLADFAQAAAFGDGYSFSYQTKRAGPSG